MSLKLASDFLLSLDFKLTKHQKLVFDLLLQGLGNQAISNQLHVSVATVQFHAQNIYRKFDVNSREQLILKIFHLNHRPEIEIKEPKTLIEHLECVQAPNEPLPRGIA